MKLELEYPYSAMWRHGYLVTNRENRRTVILYNSHSDRSSVSYARYLMAVKLARFLEPSEHVDHIDDDKTNDSISNLQILTQLENSKKAGRGRTMRKFTCPVCFMDFEVEARQVAPGKDVRCCSRRCGGIYSHR